jgi:hypothetical protein
MRVLASLAVVCALLVPDPASAQASSAAGGQELYHAHFVKAALGKLDDLIAAYKAAAVPAGEQKPIILRHREGDDWDLLVLTPYGKAETTVTAAVSADMQALYAKFRASSERHTDSFVAGPKWSDASKVLGATGGVYVVSLYRAANGHRDQLEESLKRLAAGDGPDRGITLRHVEGGPFDFMQISRYDSWNAIDAPVAGQAPMAQAMDLRQHMAEHHDTVCVRVAN